MEKDRFTEETDVASLPAASLNALQRNFLRSLQKTERKREADEKTNASTCSFTPMKKPRFKSLRQRQRYLPEVLHTSQPSSSKHIPDDFANSKPAVSSNEQITTSTVTSLPNELLSWAVCYFLGLEEVVKVSLLSKSMFNVSKQYKWVKHCICAGGMPGKLRQAFWLYGAGKVHFLQIAVALEVEWMSRQPNFFDGLFDSPFSMGSGDIRDYLLESCSGGTIREYKNACNNLGNTLFQYLVDARLDKSKDDEIRRDVSRTFPQHKLFSGSGGIGQQWLHQVLRALTSLDPASGYCQGMNFVVAAFLIHFESPSTAFWLMLTVMRHYDYSLIFAPRVPLVALRLQQYSATIREALPDVWDHLRMNSLNVDIFANQWLMTMFSYYLEANLLLYVWDVFFVCGWKAFFRIGLALLSRIKSMLLQHDIEGMLKYFQSAKHVIEDDNMEACKELLRSAYDFQVTSSQLDKIAQDFLVDKLMALVTSALVSKKSSNTENDNFSKVDEGRDSEDENSANNALLWNSGTGHGGGGEAFCGLAYTDDDILVLDLKNVLVRNRPLERISYSKLADIPSMLLMLSNDYTFALNPHPIGKQCDDGRHIVEIQPLKSAFENSLEVSTDKFEYSISKEEILNKYEALIGQYRDTEEYEAAQLSHQYKDSFPSALSIPCSVLGGTESGRFLVLDLSAAKKTALLVDRIHRQTLYDAKVFNNKISFIEKEIMEHSRAAESVRQRLIEAFQEKEECFARKKSLASTLQRLVESSTVTNIASLRVLSVDNYQDFDELEGMKVAVSRSIAAPKQKKFTLRKAFRQHASTDKSHMLDIEIDDAGDEPNSIPPLTPEEEKVMILNCLQKVINAEKLFSTKNSVFKDYESQLKQAEGILGDTMDLKQQLMGFLQKHIASSEEEKRKAVLQLFSSGVSASSVPKQLENNHCPVLVAGTLS